MVKMVVFHLIFLSLLNFSPGGSLFPAEQAGTSSRGGPFLDYEKNLDWMVWMLRPVKKDNKDFMLMQSYEALNDRCWIYDQALAVITLTAAKKTEKAKKILDTLEYIQNKDGSFYFSYLISTLEPTSGRKYTGSIGWVAMAVNFYQKMTGDKSYRALLGDILKWLTAQQVMDKKDAKFGGLSLGVRDDAFSMEHNMDCYSAFRYSGEKSYKKKAKFIKKFILRNLYHKEQARFLTGYNDNSKYLDCQTWAVLSFGKKYSHVLNFAEQHFRVKDGKLNQLDGINGFFERDARDAPVWSEGTEGAALAYYFIKNKRKGDFFHHEVKKMAGPDGGIAYATENNYEFSVSPSAAGTAWFIFYEMKLNPFKPNRKTKRSVKKFLRKYKKYSKKNEKTDVCY